MLNKYKTYEFKTSINQLPSSILLRVLSLNLFLNKWTHFCGLNRPPFLGDTNLCLDTSPAIGNKKHDVKKNCGKNYILSILHCWKPMVIYSAADWSCKYGGYL